MSSGGAPVDFSSHPVQPAQFGTKLLDHQGDHPKRLMKLMANFFLDCAQRLFLASEFARQEFFPAPELFADNLRPRLPGESHPGEEWRPLPLRGPVSALQRRGQRHAPFGGGCENTAFRAKSRLLIAGFANEPLPCKLLQRIVDLWPRHSRPILYLAAFQFQVGLVAMHGLLRQEAEQDQVGHREIALPSWRHCLLSAGGSRTATGIAPAAAADRVPEPRLLQKRPGSKYRCVDR